MQLLQSYSKSKTKICFWITVKIIFILRNTSDARIPRQLHMSYTTLCHTYDQSLGPEPLKWLSHFLLQWRDVSKGNQITPSVLASLPPPSTLQHTLIIHTTSAHNATYNDQKCQNQMVKTLISVQTGATWYTRPIQLSVLRLLRVWLNQIILWPINLYFTYHRHLIINLRYNERSCKYEALWRILPRLKCITKVSWKFSIRIFPKPFTT